MNGLNTIVLLFQQIGDRKNRHWSRLKNILYSKGLELSGNKIEDVLYEEDELNFVRDLGIKWYAGEINKLGAQFSDPIEIDLGKVNRHHGWQKQFDGKYSFGLWIENGRIKDSNNFGKVKTMIDTIVAQVQPQIRITPFQDLLLTDIDESNRSSLESILGSFNYGNFSALRTNSLACVGLSTCGLAVAESEKFLNPLMNELEKKGFGNLEGISIGISGCERHCSRNVRFDISLEGKTDGEYQLKLLFGEPDKDHLATDLIYYGKKYLRRIPQKDATNVISILIENYLKNKHEDEKNISVFHKRIGVAKIIQLFEENETTKHLTQQTAELYVA
jgi:sulfite reductase (NADPH) hemoprotein beta-component